MRVLSSPVIPLLNLLIAMLLGIFLRYLPVNDIPGVNFRFFLHAHSHVAFLGWIYMALFIGFIHTYIPSGASLKKYVIQYWLSQISVLGMLVFFPIQGYALFSILFSAMHILISYWFCYSFSKDLRKYPDLLMRFPVSLNFCKASLFFLVLSSIGPWSLGLIMSQGLANHPIYNLAIYFYLHFQYNGWFSFAAIGLVISILESKGLLENKKEWNIFFYLLLIACIPGFFLSTLYLNPPDPIVVISFLSALVQVVAVWFIVKLRKKVNYKNLMGITAYQLLVIGFICFILKILLQFFSSFLPIFEIRNFIIGYLHLTLIGFVSFTIIGLCIYYGWLKVNMFFKASLILISTGFILSEVIIFLQGFFLWTRTGGVPDYFISVLSVSLLMPIGLILLLLSQLNFNHKYFR